MSRDALVVGINTYHHLPPLKTPANDAEAVARMLEKHGNFRVKRLHAVKDETNPPGRMSKKQPVTVPQLEQELLRLFMPDGRHIPDTALFFFAGHGLRRDRQIYHEGCLAASNSSLPDQWGLSLQWLRCLLEQSKVRQQIIWLDCCYSGELLNFNEANPGSMGNVRDRCFIAGSREFEPAYDHRAFMFPSMQQQANIVSDVFLRLRKSIQKRAVAAIISSAI
ncbi:MAG: caspase family protein [Desulfobacteraceae bacterium]|nr:caspase family protein [Desulfobacteraceae bacterium]